MTAASCSTALILHPDIAIIGLSLHDDASVARAMAEAGADAYVSKHEPTKEVLDTIRRAWQRHGDRMETTG